MLGDLPYLTPRLCKIQEFLILSILVFRVVTNTVLRSAGDAASTRAEEPIIDIGAEDNSVKAPAMKALAKNLFLRLLRHRKLLPLQLLKLLL